MAKNHQKSKTRQVVLLALGDIDDDGAGRWRIKALPRSGLVAGDVWMDHPSRKKTVFLRGFLKKGASWELFLGFLYKKKSTFFLGFL